MRGIRGCHSKEGEPDTMSGTWLPQEFDFNQLAIVLYMSGQKKKGANKKRPFWLRNKDYLGGATC